MSRDEENDRVLSSREGEVVTIAHVQSEFEASTLAAVLKSAGIHAQAVGGPISDFRAEAPGYARVLVLRKQATEAHRILTEMREETKNIDWSKVDVGEMED